MAVAQYLETMWNRTWLNKILAPLGLLFLGLINPVISQAKERIDLQVNEITLNGKVYTITVIDVDPSRPLRDVFKDRVEWISYIHQNQERYNQAKQVLLATQTLVEENFLVRKRAADFAKGVAFDYPDADGTHELLLEAGIVRPKTKVEDVLTRRSVTISICEGQDWLHQSDATMKLVETDFERLYKDIKKYLPSGVFKKMAKERKIVGFEIENWSVRRKMSHNFYAYMMETIFKSGAIQEYAAVHPESMTYLQTSSSVSSQLYHATGFDDDFWNRAAQLNFMKASSLEQIDRARKFFDVKTVSEVWELSWMRERFRYTSFSGESAVDDYVREGDLMIRQYLSKPKFNPELCVHIPVITSCSGIYNEQ